MRKESEEVNLEQEYSGRGDLEEGTGKTDGLGSSDATWEMGEQTSWEDKIRVVPALIVCAYPSQQHPPDTSRFSSR